MNNLATLPTLVFVYIFRNRLAFRSRIRKLSEFFLFAPTSLSEMSQKIIEDVMTHLRRVGSVDSRVLDLLEDMWKLKLRKLIQAAEVGLNN